jgi:chromosomal replication initiation ATPase DnaA
MNTIEEVKKKYKELGELINCLEITENIFPTKANWKILFMEIAIKKYGYSMQNLQAKNRNEEVLLIRQIFMYLLRLNDLLLFKEIGAMLHKDHATVMWGVNKVKEYIQVKDVRFMNVYENFKHLNLSK